MNPSETDPEPVFVVQSHSSSISGPQQTWVLKPQPVVRIGRSSGCEIVIQHPMVSRLHAELFWRDDHWELVSRGRYGTYLDGDPVESIAVGPKANLFQFGEGGPYLQFVFELSDKLETAGTMMPMMFALPAIDALARDEQVENIASSDFFRSLKEKASGLRRRPEPSGSTPPSSL